MSAVGKGFTAQHCHALMAMLVLAVSRGEWKLELKKVPLTMHVRLCSCISQRSCLSTFTAVKCRIMQSLHIHQPLKPKHAT